MKYIKSRAIWFSLILTLMLGFGGCGSEKDSSITILTNSNIKSIFDKDVNSSIKFKVKNEDISTFINNEYQNGYTTLKVNFSSINTYGRSASVFKNVVTSYSGKMKIEDKTYLTNYFDNIDSSGVLSITDIYEDSGYSITENTNGSFSVNFDIYTEKEINIEYVIEGLISEYNSHNYNSKPVYSPVFMWYSNSYKYQIQLKAFTVYNSDTNKVLFKIDVI